MTDIDAPLLDVRKLRIGFRGRHGLRTVVEGLDLTIRRGEAVALVGESGSGKSVTARALVGLNDASAVIEAERFELAGQDVRGWNERRWRGVRGREVGFVLQDALGSLDPLARIGSLLAEVLRAQTVLPRHAIAARSAQILQSVGIPDPQRRLRQYPHQLSGGLRQRALIGTAIASDPPLLIADEPTTALDATVQKQILELLAQRRALGSALLLISHDLAVVNHIADRVLVIQAGQVVEQGPVAQVLSAPQHPYTRQLLQAVPTAASRGLRLAASPLQAPAAWRVPLPPKRIDSQRQVLEVDGLRKRYGHDPRAPLAVDDVSFALAAGETLGIVGESGSGKSTVARIVLGLTEPDAGRVLLDGLPWSGLPERRRRARRVQLQLVAQDPYASFDPRHTVGRIIGESLDPLRLDAAERRRRVLRLLDEVQLGASAYERHPRELSGGQRQRVALARAFAPNPALLVADEPVSALDASVQAQVLDLFADLQAEHGTALLLISHDLGVIGHLADRVLVMRGGRVLESGPVERVLVAPNHPYTRALIEALPSLPARTCNDDAQHAAPAPLPATRANAR
ncbi:MAG: ABC transporter ATP-binding protein [Pseudoxanthomonas sp.]